MNDQFAALGFKPNSPTPTTQQISQPTQGGDPFAALGFKQTGTVKTQDNSKSVNPLTNTATNAVAGMNQGGEGINEVFQGVNEGNNGNMTQGMTDIGKGALDTVSGGLSEAFSPISGIMDSLSHIPVGNGENIGDRIQKNGIQPIANVISDIKPLQDFMQNNPDADKVAGNLINIGMALAGGKKAPEIKGAIGDATSVITQPIGDAIDTVKSAVSDVNPIKGDISNLSPEDQQVAIEKAKQNVADAYQKSLPLTPSQQIKETSLLNKTGDNVYTTLAKYNISPASEDAIPQLQSLSDKFSEATDIARQNENAYFNINEIKNNAYSSIDSSLSSATERSAAKLKVNGEISDLMSESPDSFTKDSNGQLIAKSDIVERLRKTGNQWAQYNKINPDTVRNATGDGLANAVRDQVEKQGTFPAYREANREWGKVIHAEEILKKISDSGKTFKVMGGLSGSVARKVLSGALGYHTGGIGGAILSELGTEYMSKILSNPDLRTYFDIKLIENFGDTKATPKSIQSLTDQVKEYIDTQSKLLRLPSPQSIQVSPTNVDTPGSVIQGKYGEPVQPNGYNPEVLQLPAGTPGTINGSTIKLKSPSTIEAPAKSIGHSN